MAVADQDVGPAIIVEIQESDAPAKKPRVLAETRLKRPIVKDHVAKVPVKTGGVSCEIRLHEVKIAVTIVVDGRYAHAGLGLSIGAVGGAGLDGDIGERAVVIILVQRRRS